MKQILNEVMIKGYGIIPRSIMKSRDLSIYEKALLSYFLSYTGAGEECCWPSLNTIAEDLQISKTTVVKNIKSLQEKGYIGKNKKDPDNKFSVNMYTMFFEFMTGAKYKVTVYDPDNEPDLVQEVNQGSTGDELGVVQEVNPINNSININKKNNIYKEVLAHWNKKKMYSHKEGTFLTNLKKKHRTIIKDIGKEELLQAIDNYSKIVAGEAYYFRHKWSLWDFIERGAYKFVDAASPFKNYRKEGNPKDTPKDPLIIKDRWCDKCGNLIIGTMGYCVECGAVQ